MAREMLAQNVANRPIRNSWVSSLAGALRRGEWKRNGDTLRFNKAGHLLDGQHRLLAVVQAEVAAEMYVIRGLDDDVVETIDVGAKRSFGDLIKFLGVESTNYSLLASAVTLLFAIQNDRWSGSAQATNTQKHETLERNPRLTLFVEEAQRLYRATKLNASAATVALYKIDEVAGAAALSAFLDQLMSGEDLSKGDPRLALRNYLVVQRVDGHNRTKKQHFLAAIKAWNYYVQNKPLNRIIWGKTEELVFEPLVPEASAA